MLSSGYADSPYWECTSLGMVEWDTDFTVRAWSPGAVHIFGYSEAEMTGRYANCIVPECEHGKVAAVMARLASGEKYISLRNLNVCKNGTIITCDWYNTCLLDADDRIAGYASLVQDVSEQASVVKTVDITARKKAEASLRLVNTLTKHLCAAMDIDSIAKRTVSSIVKLNDPVQVAFYLYEEDSAHLRLVEHHGFDDETVRKGAFLPLKGSLAGLAVTERTLQISEGLPQDRRLEPAVRSLLASNDIRAGVAIPLLCDDQVLGVLNLVYSSARVFDNAERSTLMSVGWTIGLSMSNASHLASLEYQARHDSLTGLPNRTFLHHECECLKERVDESHQRVALILFDIDRFKEINDTLGHRVGDRLLISIGERVTTALQQKDLMFCRLGGDEFALLLAFDDGNEQVRRDADELLGILEKPFELDGLMLEVSASAGVAFYPEQAGDSHELLRCADVAMYRAKRTRTHLEVYDPVFDEHSPERLSLMVELRQAIHDNQLVLHYQPKVNLHENRVSGFEALVRWQHPRLGLLLPGDFIGFAEMGETIHALTNWVIDTALAQLRRWQDDGYDLCMAINISTRNLVDQAFPDTLKELIDKHQVEAGRIELEITESSLISDPERTQASLNQIASLGVALSIDDFGTGYSSLGYLKRLPVQAIKIDRSFVTNMLADQQDLVIVRSTINMACNLGLRVVAEGTEDRATYDTLRGMGCDFVQGLYVGKPLDGDLLDEHLQNGELNVLKKASDTDGR